MKKERKRFTHLSFEERFAIERLFHNDTPIRGIAALLGRSPNTVSYEIKRNSVRGTYSAKKAKTKAYGTRYRAKKDCLKVAMEGFLARFVEEKLRAKWSPKQISGFLKEECGITCSAKAIYKFAERRCLDHLLFWGWNKKKPVPKRYRVKNARDGRKYIDERPETDGIGHFEIDFVVSKQSTYSFLVATDRMTKKTLINILPNRKHATVIGALSGMFAGVDVKSITADNDISFACWERMEEVLGTRVYFTRPYHSWEKGLVENTNRWIRCFVPKRRDIGTVSDEELAEILSFINDRPREIIGFRMPSVYYSSLSVS